MARPIIEAKGLSKSYQLGETLRHDTLRDAVSQGFSSLFGKGTRSVEARPKPDGDFWALKDVSFDVQQGEVIGVIGRNGAGKSTLLKILSRITDPTRGEVRLRGRVASLLEVGTGFHPELTGRENIFLNGAILGMRKTEIRKKFDDIVAFAEIEKFLDTPVKRYSSGMYVRLAFAVAAHLEPEILIVDEVLAVGDMAFQKKCLGKMDDVSRSGRTIIFVSHNMAALQGLCDRAILLNSGRVVADGATDEVVSMYLQDGTMTRLEQSWEDPQSAPGNDKIRFHKVRLAPIITAPDSQIDITNPFKMEFEFWNFMADIKLNFSLHLYTASGAAVLASVSDVFIGKKGIVKGSCSIPGDLLNDGAYHVMIMVVQDASNVIYRLDDALVFEVHDNRRRVGSWYGRWPGVVRPKLAWDTDILE